MMKILRKIPLHSCEEKFYTGALFSGCSYKFLAPKKELIDIYTTKLNKVCSKNICDAYESISLSKKNEEYYVIKENDYENIYVINNKFEELCTVKLNVPVKYKKKIYSISLDCENCKIYITLDNIVYSVTLQGDFIKEEISKCSLDKMRCSTVRQINYRCCSGYNPVNLKITCASFICGNLVVAYIKNESLYISKLSESGNIIDTIYIDDDIFVNEIFSVKGKIELLVTKQNKYNYIYITDLSCCSKLCKNMCEIVNKCEHKSPCACEKNKCCKDEICDIIESIALIETAISHILNAEGEKIQKAVKIACKCEDLIEVNESVARTITNVTMLESVLTDKLSLAIKKK